MEQIVKISDGWYYGSESVGTVDKAYRCFREDYNRAVGRDSNARLNSLGQRTDVLHWSGFFFSKEHGPEVREFEGREVVSRIIGIVCTSYCKMLEIPLDIPDEKMDLFIDWILTDGNKALRLVGRKSGLGRTNKRHNINYR